MSDDWLNGLTHNDWLFDGWPIKGNDLTAWNDLDWSKARIDMGPSPAGNPGPYWHVPRKTKDTVHRLYPKVLKSKWLPVIRRACTDVARLRKNEHRTSARSSRKRGALGH